MKDELLYLTIGRRAVTLLACAYLSALCLQRVAPLHAQPTSPVVGQHIARTCLGSNYILTMTADGNIYRMGDSFNNPAIIRGNFWNETGVMPRPDIVYQIAVFATESLVHVVMLGNGDVYTKEDSGTSTFILVGNFWEGTSITPTPESLAGFHALGVNYGLWYYVMLPSGDLYERTGSWSGPPVYRTNYWGTPLPTEQKSWGAAKHQFKGKGQ